MPLSPLPLAGGVLRAWLLAAAVLALLLACRDPAARLPWRRGRPRGTPVPGSHKSGQ